MASGDRVQKIKGPGGKLRGYIFFCPGCDGWHQFMTEPWSRDGKAGPVWSFDGNMQLPTFSPSLLIYAHPTQPRCHSFVRKGQIQYCSDCDHALAGKTVDLPEVDKLP